MYSIKDAATSHTVPRGIGSGGGAEIAGVDSNGGNRMRWTMKEWISPS